MSKKQEDIIFTSMMGEIFEYDSVLLCHHSGNDALKVYLYSNIVVTLNDADVDKFLVGYYAFQNNKYEITDEEGLSGL